MLIKLQIGDNHKLDQPRPHKDQSKDWPKYDKKPIDFAFGPYADSFSEQQHKYGPYMAIKKFYNK